MSSQKDTRGADPLDHLRIACSEGNVVATKVAKAAYEYAIAELAALRGKLEGQKTADGVAVGLEPIRIYWPCGGKVYEGAAGLEMQVICVDAADPSVELEPHCGIAGVYATREAAESVAKEQING